MNQNFKQYIIFWLSQAISQLGSAMTSFTLILWAYEQVHSAMAVSILSFCNYVPYILVSIFAGAFVDQHNKKKILLLTDSIAAVCSVVVLLLSMFDLLKIWHIYLINGIIGFMNSFQSPTSSVVIGKIVPKEKLAQVSGMNSFSSNLTTVLTPILAAFLFSFGGLKIILFIDLSSFLLAFFVLLLYIHIPEEKTERKKRSLFSDCKEGITFLLNKKNLWIIILTMAVLNFFSRLTYENILSPMLLSRSGNNNLVLGTVNAMMGIGGIIGGILVSTGKFSKNPIKMIYLSAMISFLFGDLLMGLGRTPILWSIAGIAASLPIPFINAGQNVILYETIPFSMQGRVFAVKNAIQYSTIPIGILLGGFLADYIFEPFMQSEKQLAVLLQHLVGNSAGSGMALMFLCTGICGGLFSLLCYHSKEIKSLRK